MEVISISFWGYLYCTVMFFLTFYLAYKFRNDKRTHYSTWFLILAYCLYSVWGDDYVGYYLEYTYSMDKDYRDILYSFIKGFTFGSYMLFRLIVWGSALLLFYFVIMRLKLNINISIFIFVISFMMTFSYARVSLAMALYFYGMTFIIKPIYHHRFISYLLGFVIVALSYYGHRSMLPLIVISPMAFININRKHIYFLLACFPIALMLVTTVLQGFLTEELQLSSDFEKFNEAANKIARIDNRVYSVRSQISSFIHYSGIYIPYFYLIHKFCFTSYVPCSFNIKGLLYVTTIIIYAATAFFLSDSIGATEALGYRYLYMAYIPIIIAMSYLYGMKIITTKTLFKVMFLGFMYESLTSITILHLF